MHDECYFSLNKTIDLSINAIINLLVFILIVTIIGRARDFLFS